MAYRQRICPKCGGAGELPHYSHVEGGICFLCRGTGFLEDVVDSTDDVVDGSQMTKSAFVSYRPMSSQKPRRASKYMCQVEDPQQVRITQDRNGQRSLLAIDIQGCDLQLCKIIWVRTFRVRRGEHLLIPELEVPVSKKNSLRFPHCPERILLPEPGSPLVPTDIDTVWFGFQIHDMEHLAREAAKDLNEIHYLIIPCSALEAAQIPGFEEGCF